MIEHSKRSPHHTAPLHAKAKAKTQQAVVQPVVSSYAGRITAPAITTASLRVSTARGAGSRSKTSSHDEASSLAGARSSSGDDHASGGEDHVSRSDHQTSRSGDRSTASEDAHQSDSSDSPASATHERKREDAPRESDHAAKADQPQSDSATAAPEHSDGGITTTTTPVATVTVPSGDAPPVVGVPRPGDDG
jgi:hypothetical protein